MKMLAKKVSLMLCMMIVLVPALVQAESGGRGRYLFRKDCRTCHGKEGHAANLTPQSKTSKEWQDFFENDKHQAKADVWTEISYNFV